MVDHRLLAAFLLLAGVGAGLAAGTPWTSHSGKYSVTYKSEIDPVVINRIHNWTLVVTDSRGEPVEGATVSVDGGMPAHDHGLPTAPRITGETAPGHYLLEGLRFHMAGKWEIIVRIEIGDSSDTIVIPLDL